MKIAAGRLDRRVTLLEPVQERSAVNGEITTVWTSRGTRAAQKLRLMPDDQANAEQLIATASSTLLMRLDRGTRAIDPTWRIRMDDVDYDVVGTDDDRHDASLLVYIVGLKS